MGIFMLLITFKYKNLKYFIDNTIYLYMCSVILAGFLYFLKIEFNNFSYLISLTIAPIILYLYIKNIKELKQVVNYYKKVIINFKNNNSLELTGFIDSGNKLKDPITNKYIILINKKKIKGIYNIRSPMYVPIKVVNNNNKTASNIYNNQDNIPRIFKIYLLEKGDDHIIYNYIYQYLELYGEKEKGKKKNNKSQNNNNIKSNKTLSAPSSTKTKIKNKKQNIKKDTYLFRRRERNYL